MFLSCQGLCFCEFYTGRFKAFLQVKAAEPSAAAEAGCTVV